jgi:hypothetical protein
MGGFSATGLLALFEPCQKMITKCFINK